VDIKCKVTNVASETYKNIMFRKFFQIIFFNENMKRIDIYSATVFGGNSKSTEEVDFCNFNSEIDKEFRIKFEFIVDEDSSNKDNVTITNEDCSDSFLKQVSKTKRIWGKYSREVSTQEDIDKYLKKILGIYRNYNNCINNNKNNCDECDRKQKCIEECFYHKNCKECSNFKLVDIDTNITKKEQKYLYLSNNEEEGSLAVKADFDIDDSAFTIKGKDDLHNGVEIFNWMHTKIEFTKKQDFEQKPVKYVIDFPKGKMWTPDFTLYIGPPEGDIINLNSGAKVGDESVRDAFQEVLTYEELYYKEWIDECNIMNKKMHRILKDKLFVSQDKQFDKKNIEITINFKDEIKKEISQFIFGIIMSTILAFGIDYTRMGAIKKCFIPAIFLPDIQWIFMCLLIVLLYRRIKLRKKGVKYKKTRIFLNILSWVGIICLAMWFVTTFIAYQGYVNYYIPWRMIGEKLINSFSNFESIYFIVVDVLLALGWICSLIYLTISYTIVKCDYLNKKLFF